MHILCEAKVNYFGLKDPIIFENHDIFKFEIAMHEIVAMNIIETYQKFFHNFFSFINLENLAHLEKSVQRLSKQLHDNIDRIF